MERPNGFVEVRRAGIELLVAAECAHVDPEAWFDTGAPLADAKGRGSGVGRLDIEGRAVVVRTYRRGGLLRRALPDAFPTSARAVRELLTLARLRDAGVPVVAPICAASRRRGPLRELRLATLLIEGALPLPAFVARHPDLRRVAVRAAGEVVGQAFAVGLVHPDLHPDNLVAAPSDGGCTVHLLDLDRARIAASPDRVPRGAMLVRMARYLLRHRDTLPVRAQWTDRIRFLAGLGLDRAERRGLVVELGPELQRQAARRNLTLDPLPGSPAVR
ncbi:MAG: lipopolysaccharide kinase InaA family protein [Planctomycetota bacterium]